MTRYIWKIEVQLLLSICLFFFVCVEGPFFIFSVEHLGLAF